MACPGGGLNQCAKDILYKVFCLVMISDLNVEQHRHNCYRLLLLVFCELKMCIKFSLQFSVFNHLSLMTESPVITITFSDNHVNFHKHFHGG